MNKTIIFDSSCIIHYLNRDQFQNIDIIDSQIRFFDKILKNKSNYWTFLCTDSVFRETSRVNYHLMKYFDKVLHTSWVPMVLPSTLPSQGDLSNIQFFISTGNLSRKDAYIVADSVNANSDYLVTNDFKLLRNQYVVQIAYERHNLNIVSPQAFYEEKENTIIK